MQMQINRMHKLRDSTKVSLRPIFFFNPIYQFGNEFASESRFPEHKITDGTSLIYLEWSCKKVFSSVHLSDLLLLLLQIQSILPRSFAQKKRVLHVSTHLLKFRFMRIFPGVTRK